MQVCDVCATFRTLVCAFSELRVYPGHGKQFVRRDGQVWLPRALVNVSAALTAVCVCVSRTGFGVLELQVPQLVQAEEEARTAHLDPGLAPPEQEGQDHHGHPPSQPQDHQVRPCCHRCHQGRGSWLLGACVRCFLHRVYAWLPVLGVLVFPRWLLNWCSHQIDARRRAPPSAKASASAKEIAYVM